MSMEKFVIEGRYPLSAELNPSGNKNERLPVLVASLLTDEVVHYTNVPQIRDVEVLCDVISSIERNEVKICVANVNTGILTPGLCRGDQGC